MGTWGGAAAALGIWLRRARRLKRGGVMQRVGGRCSGC